MDDDVVDALERLLGSRVIAHRPVHGGDFATASKVELADRAPVFLKTHADPPPGFFSTEAAGLRWLHQADAVRVPEVLAVSDDPPLLVLEWVEVGPRREATESDFGRALAHLHRSGASSFGRTDGRTTGSLAMPNASASSWAEFYATRRLEPLAEIAESRRSLPGAVVEQLLGVAQDIADLIGPEEPPARLHGDLWAGNRLVDVEGRSWLIDPACFGGHREFDLAMMRLFGGFAPAVFEAYDAEFPLAPGWADRVPLYQIAPLVVHAIKFGGSYVGAAADAIARYT